MDLTATIHRPTKEDEDGDPGKPESGKGGQRRRPSETCTTEPDCCTLDWNTGLRPPTVDRTPGTVCSNLDSPCNVAWPNTSTTTGEVGQRPAEGAVVRGLDTADSKPGPRGYQHRYPSPCTFQCSKLIMKTEGKRKRLSPQPGSPTPYFTPASSASDPVYFPQHGHPNA
ncbi:UNVERIFIED_CONTAM: hypothetical protein FKN15_042424 [Acipenser sinensis]